MKRCRNCSKEYDGRGKFFCSVKCRQEWRNSPENNPVNSPQVRAKISEAMKGNTNCDGRQLSADTRQKIADALTGRPQTEEHRRKRVQGWKAAFKRRGGMSKRHKRQLDSLHRSGSEHWNWKGGTSTQRDTEFRTQAYKDFVAAVLARDDYTCQRCQARNGNGITVDLEVHHIKSYAEHEELRFDPSNGITLCRDCHNATKAGRPRPRRKDFVPRPRICQMCGKEFTIRNPRKYCPECRAKYCCPICGSTVCHHHARTQLAHALPARQ